MNDAIDASARVHDLPIDVLERADEVAAVELVEPGHDRDQAAEHHARARFHEVVGEPPMAFLTSWRMASAADLLVGGDTTVAHVAEQDGTGSPFTFSTAFKLVYGLNPKAHRDRAVCLSSAHMPDSHITPQMLDLVGLELRSSTSFPVTDSDIRRWAIAVYYPEPAPRLFWDAVYAAGTVHGGIVAPVRRAMSEGGY